MRTTRAAAEDATHPRQRRGRGCAFARTFEFFQDFENNDTLTDEEREECTNPTVTPRAQKWRKNNFYERNCG